MKRIDDYKQQIEHWKGVIQDIQLEADEERVLAQREKELRRAAEAEVERLREALNAVMPGLDDYWSQIPEGMAAIEIARAALRGERESREGCRSANCEKAGASWDHPHPAHPSLGALYGKGGEDETERLPEEQCVHSGICCWCSEAHTERLCCAHAQRGGGE